MECNRDEAARSKAIAERKFHAKDYRGAKKFAMKAHALFPGLEGIEQMLATLEVYVSAENRVNGEADWYGILGTTAAADEDTVRKQYRKLALLLHPDKNKSVGAEGAFKLLSEAWSLLSDKTRRATYDQRRNIISFQTKAAPPNKGPPPPAANGFYNFAKTNASTSRANKNIPGANTTFWTVCLKCKVQYEYLRKYLNHNLLCPNCHQPFIAKETPPPVRKGVGSNKTKTSGVRSGSLSNSHARNSFEWTPFSGASGVSAASQVASVVQQTYEKVKKEREDAQAKKRREKSMKRKNRAYDKMGIAAFGEHSDAAKKRQGIYNADLDSMGHMTFRTGEVGRGRHTTMHENGISKPGHQWELSYSELYGILSGKARKEIQNRANQEKLSNVAKNELQNEETAVKACIKVKGSENAELYLDSCNQGSRRSASLGDRGAFVPMYMDVPDPDFCDFDKDRTGRSFVENQVWAAYDDDDGMPRYYASVHRILSRNPFKMQIRWLNSRTDAEQSGLNWVGAGFTKTCGDYRTGGFEIYESVNAFSHKVRCAKGSRGDIRIFPATGEVWALYKNWSPDWNELTASDVIHKYEMVEVLGDYDEEVGVVVIPLVKVAGFKAVFHHHLDPKEVRRIPREEMSRFSHQVPSRLLSGREARNAPKGCWELDPAATPIELFQVMGPMNVEDLPENDANGWEGPAHDDHGRASSLEMRENDADVKENTADAREKAANVRENTADAPEKAADARGNTADARGNTADAREKAADEREKPQTENKVSIEVMTQKVPAEVIILDGEET